MERRDFLGLSSGTLATLALSARGVANAPARIDAAWYRHSRRFVELPMCRVAYVEYGSGPAALFVHGYTMNGFQWRGALERLHTKRRCIAPDLMSMGYTQTPASQIITPETQVALIGALLDALHIETVDLVASDSGGIVAQLFVARFPQRVRTLLLANCDVDENNPPPQFLPYVALAKEGLLVDRVLIPQLNDKELARSPKGLGGLCFTYPERFSDETIDTYWRPLVETPLKKMQFNQYSVNLALNVLVPIRDNLRQWQGPARMVWGLKDEIFPVKWADWLDRTLPGSRGVRRVEEANLFFPEEMPDLIAEEASRLWDTKRSIPTVGDGS